MKPRRLTIIVALAFSFTLAGCSTTGQGSDPNNPHQLEAITWWSTGPEKEAIDSLVAVFEQRHANIEFINASVAGEAGLNAQAAIASRLEADNPPDTFQAHAGAELIDYIEAGQLQDLSSFYVDAGLTDAFPPSLIERLTIDKRIYSVPTNIHRANVTWVNTSVLTSADINPERPPDDMDAWIADLSKLRNAGVEFPLALGTEWIQVQLFENCLIAALGPGGYNNLWAGYLKWDGPGVRSAVAHYGQLLEFVDPTSLGGNWREATQRVIDGRAGYTVMGDWANGAFSQARLTYGEEYTSFPTPGTAGTFDFLADSFTLPVGAPHEQAARDWLTTISSEEGQKAVNIAKGSIPARIDAVASDYPAYQKTAITSFANDQIVGSLAHGAAARITWAADISSAVGKFGKDGFQEALINALLQAAEDACEAGTGPAGLSLCPDATG